jgi:hypothetical protein
MHGIPKSVAAGESAVRAVSLSVLKSFKEKSRVQTNKRDELQRTQTASDESLYSGVQSVQANNNFNYMYETTTPSIFTS